MKRSVISPAAKAAMLTVLLSGCGRELTEGEIIDKRHEPESTFVMLIPMVVSCGKTCTTTILIPYVVHDDEDWVLVIRGRDKDGDELTEDWYVSEKEYEAAPVGRKKVYDDRVVSRNDEHEKLRKADR
jgi:hypothetical protein